MKNFIIVLACIVIGSLLVFSVQDTNVEEQEVEVSIHEIRIQENAIRVVNRLYYVQDSRTNICFATRTSGNFGVLAEVDCDQIPEEMLLRIENSQE